MTWHLRNTGQNGGTVGMDLNVTDVWSEYTGRGVTVAVYDDGIDANHPELRARTDGSGYDASLQLANNHAGIEGTNLHGIAVAGIIGAANDGVGPTGVAYGARLVSVDLNGGDGANNYNATPWLLGSQAFDVVNHSYGWSDRIETINVNDLNDIATSAQRGRGGLGTIHVKSAGNGHDLGFHGSANLSNFSNSRFAITVGALDNTGAVTEYSTRGSPLLVSAFGGPHMTPDDSGGFIQNAQNILTTDRADTIDGNNNDGYNLNGDTTRFNGTSAAAPQVSGIIALMLEANPRLGWRDVQDILAYSARHVGGPVNSPRPVGHEDDIWGFNQAKNWNGGGLHFSSDYGFGLVDAHAAVRLAETWDKHSVSSNERTLSQQSLQGNQNVTDNGSASVLTFRVPDNIDIERVEIDLQMSHPDVSDLVVELTSPNGTTTELLEGHGWRNAINGIVLSSNEFRGELSAGVWTLTVRDIRWDDDGLPADPGQSLRQSDLTIFGSGDTTNDTYIYTNEFAQYAQFPNQTGHGFAALDDDGGFDTINAAAVTTSSTIDLEGGFYSIAGIGGYFNAGYTDPAFNPNHAIEHIIGGDGEDTLGGNFAANMINGGRGADALKGYGGSDRLIGGRGNDMLIGGRDADVLWGGDELDTASYETSLAGVTVNLSTGLGEGGDAEDDILADIEKVIGSAYADTLIGSAWDDDLQGGGGRDTLRGGAGADTLMGGADIDSFVFENGWGLDIIGDFENGAELLDMRLVTGLTSFNQLSVSYLAEFNTTSIAFNDNGTDGILLVGIDAIDASDFMFANAAPVASIENQTVEVNQWVKVTDWLSASDANGASTITQYEFWDEGMAANSGYLWTHGYHQHAAGSALTVNATDLVNTWVRGGESGGSETMRVRAFDGQDWSAWDSFTLTTRANAKPLATIGDHTLAVNKWVKVQDWLSATDADGDAITKYEFWDEGMAAGSGYFFTPGNHHHAAGSAFTVNAADLANTWVRGGESVGSETMRVRAFDGKEWSDWDSFALTTTNAKPVAAIEDHKVAVDQWVTVQSWLSSTDADGHAITKYEFWDGGTAADSAYFWTPGNHHHAAGSAFTVNAADLAQTWIQGGQTGQSETMWVRSFDGTEWSDWDAFKVTTNSDPVMTVGDRTVGANNWVQVQSWLSATDVDGDAMTKYEFWDSGTGATSGYFWTPNNEHHSANTTISVDAANLSTTWVRGGSEAGSEQMWVRGYDGSAWSTWHAFNLTTTDLAV